MPTTASCTEIPCAGTVDDDYIPSPGETAHARTMERSTGGVGILFKLMNFTLFLSSGSDGQPRSVITATRKNNFLEIFGMQLARLQT